MGESAWKYGGYRRGMSGSLEGDEDALRRFYAIEGIKRELRARGFGRGVQYGTGKFGSAAHQAARGFQKTVFPDEPIEWDGVVGPKTANALWAYRIRSEQTAHGIAKDWLRAHLHWESADDPGAELVNEDGSRDRGLTQANDQHDNRILTDAQAFDPAVAIEERAVDLEAWRESLGTCSVTVVFPDGKTKRKYDVHAVAVSAMRTPVGAKALAESVEPVEARRVQEGGTWEQAAAFYIYRVDTAGRAGWVG